MTHHKNLDPRRRAPSDSLAEEEVQQLIADDWLGELSVEGRQRLEQVLASDELQLEEAEALARTWQGLQTVGDAAPDDLASRRMQKRFEAQLAATVASEGQASKDLASLSAAAPHRAAPASRNWGNPRVAAALVAGLLLGVLVSQHFRTRAELLQLRSQVAAVHEATGVALLTHASASERLRGVGFSGRSLREDLRDERVIDGLLLVALKDPNDAVRIAALEALAPVVDRPQVGRQLVQWVAEERSPLVQEAALATLLQGRRSRLDAIDLLRSDAIPSQVQQRFSSEGESL